MKSTLLLALVALPAPTLLAQAPSAPCINPAPRVLPWPGGISQPDTAGLDLAIVGDFDGDLTGDSIWVSDGTAILAVKPAVYDELTYPVASGSTVLDFVSGLALCPAGPSDQADAFFATNGAGLAKWRFLGITSSVPQFSVTAIETSLWVGATHLHHADLDAEAGPDVIGINAAQDRVLVVRHDGSGFSSTQQIAVPLGEIWDVAPVDWFGTGVDCIAVLTAGGLAIVDPTLPSPQVVKAYEGVADAGVITALTLANGHEVIAWARESATLAPHLVLRGSGDLAAGPIWLSLKDCANPSLLTSVTPFAIEACEYDTAAGDELVLALPAGANSRLTVLMNQGSWPYFTTSSDTGYDVATTSSGYGFPGVGQLDDGPEDIAMPLDTGDLEIFVALPYAFAVENGPPTEETVILPQTEWGQAGGTPEVTTDRQLHMAFVVPDDYSWATHIEVRLWYLDDPAVYPHVDSITYHKLHELLSSTEGQFIVLDDMADGLAWPTRHHYFTEFRFVECESSAIVQASKVFTLAFTLCEDPPPIGLAPADGDFIATLVGTSYSFDTGFKIYNECKLTHPENPPQDGAVHGFFYPGARPPIEPGNVPPPPGLVEGSAALGIPQAQ